jgi:putative membrane protein
MEWSATMMNGWDMSGWGWVWMTVMMLLIIAAAVWIAVVLARGGAMPGTRSEPQDPVTILDQRFARGEIDEDQYRRRRQMLLAPEGNKETAKE